MLLAHFKPEERGHAISRLHCHLCRIFYTTASAAGIYNKYISEWGEGRSYTCFLFTDISSPNVLKTRNYRKSNIKVSHILFVIFIFFKSI